MAYESTESGVSEVYVRPFAPNAPTADAASAKVSLHGGSSPAWRADGKQLLYLTRGSPGNLKVWAADVTLKPSFARRHPAAAGRDSGRRSHVRAGCKTGAGAAAGGVAEALDRGRVELAGGVAQMIAPAARAHWIN